MEADAGRERVVVVVGWGLHHSTQRIWGTTMVGEGLWGRGKEGYLAG